MVFALRSGEFDGLSDDELHAGLAADAREVARIEARRLRRIAEIEARRSFEDEGYRSITSFVAHRCGISGGRAAGLVRVARALLQMPHTRAALDRGDIDLVAVRRLAAAQQVNPPLFSEIEATLVEAARDQEPRVFRRIVDLWSQNAAPEAALDREDGLRERRRLSVSETFEGMWRVDGDLDPESGAIVKTALDALTDRTNLDESDTRTPGQARADAFTDLCRDHLDHGDTPFIGGEKPHLSIVVDVDALSGGDARFCEIQDIGVLTTSRTARRHACDSSICRIVVNGDSEILDLGRRTRTISPALRRALIARDGGCVVGGCQVPARWTDAHHVQHWIDGGPTALWNLVLLCRFHHTLVHEGKIEIKPP
jgi:hypothetical protein